MEGLEDTDMPVEYDMSFSTNTRINVILYECNECLKKEDILMWLKCNRNLLKELSIGLKPEELEVYNNKLREIEKAVDEYQEYVKTYDLISAKKGQPFSPPRQAFDLLYELELTLRKKLDEMGFLVKRKEDTHGL